MGSGRARNARKRTHQEDLVVPTPAPFSLPALSFPFSLPGAVMPPWFNLAPPAAPDFLDTRSLKEKCDEIDDEAEAARRERYRKRRRLERDAEDVRLREKELRRRERDLRRKERGERIKRREPSEDGEVVEVSTPPTPSVERVEKVAQGGDVDRGFWYERAKDGMVVIVKLGEDGVQERKKVTVCFARTVFPPLDDADDDPVPTPSPSTTSAPDSASVTEEDPAEAWLSGLGIDLSNPPSPTRPPLGLADQGMTDDPLITDTDIDTAPSRSPSSSSSSTTFTVPETQLSPIDDLRERVKQSLAERKRVATAAAALAARQQQPPVALSPIQPLPQNRANTFTAFPLTSPYYTASPVSSTFFPTPFGSPTGPGYPFSPAFPFQHGAAFNPHPPRFPNTFPPSPKRAHTAPELAPVPEGECDALAIERRSSLDLPSSSTAVPLEKAERTPAHFPSSSECVLEFSSDDDGGDESDGGTTRSDSLGPGLMVEATNDDVTLATASEKELCTSQTASSSSAFQGLDRGTPPLGTDPALAKQMEQGRMPAQDSPDSLAKTLEDTLVRKVVQDPLAEGSEHNNGDWRSSLGIDCMPASKGADHKEESASSARSADLSARQQGSPSTTRPDLTAMELVAQAFLSPKAKPKPTPALSPRPKPTFTRLASISETFPKLTAPVGGPPPTASLLPPIHLSTTSPRRTPSSTTLLFPLPARPKTPTRPLRPRTPTGPRFPDRKPVERAKTGLGALPDKPGGVRMLQVQAVSEVLPDVTSEVVVERVLPTRPTAGRGDIAAGVDLKLAASEVSRSYAADQSSAGPSGESRQNAVQPLSARILPRHSATTSDGKRRRPCSSDEPIPRGPWNVWED